uniref:Uncharacterized protein n=1 Tax=Panagrolaimus sp. PS1159 TaxID=55785 RepID=A0AC35GR18_9BILA
MGNAIYGKNLSCFDTVEHCAEHCGKYECVFVDKCNGNANLNYICLPIDTRYLTWILFACFLIVILTCSAIVASSKKIDRFYLTTAGGKTTKNIK